MLTRRTLLASSAATVAAPAVLTGAHAATPKGVAVMAKQIDDIVSFDPAEFVRVHQRRGGRQLLPTADPAGPERCDQDRGRPGREVGRQQGRPDLHLQAAPRRQVRLRQSGDRERRRVQPASRGQAEQDAGIHRHAVRLQPGQRGEDDPRDGRLHAGDEAAERGGGDQLRAVLPERQRRQRRGHEDGHGEPDQRRSRATPG